MKSTLLTGSLALLALVGMTAAAQAQFPVVRGIARGAVRAATSGVNVNVGPRVVVGAPGVVVTRPGVVAARSVVVGRPLLSSSVTASTAVAHSAVMSDSVAYAGGTVYSESYFGASQGAAYSNSGAVASSSAAVYSEPVYGGGVVVSRPGIASTSVGVGLGSGVQVQTRRVGVHVGR